MSGLEVHKESVHVAVAQAGETGKCDSMEPSAMIFTLSRSC